MGLDSVELLMGFEDFFSIQVPDFEAEKIRTVQEMIDSVAKHRNISNDSKKLRETMVTLIQQHLDISESDKIFSSFHPSEKIFWKELELKTNLKIPLPEVKPDDDRKGLGRLLNVISWKPCYNWQEIDLVRFCEVICFANFEKLVNSETINDKFEIYAAIAGITQDRTSIDFYEIFPEKTFTDDFGID